MQVKNLYLGAVITGVIWDYGDSTLYYKVKYDKLSYKQWDVKPSDLAPLVKDLESQKFQLILDKLELTPAQEKTFTEHQWQEKILTITLIYPAYSCFKILSVKRKGILIYR